MSRIGKMPITIPKGVKIAVAGERVSVEGPKGKLAYQLTRGIEVKMEGETLVVSTTETDKQAKASFGTARANINNMVNGVSTGWKKVLELTGVGFIAKMAGTTLTIEVGFSHPVVFPIPKEVQCAVTKTTITLESPDKVILGTFAAKIRDTHPPEPYLGKGIKYSDEVVRRKAGKTAAGGKK